MASIEVGTPGAHARTLAQRALRDVLVGTTVTVAALIAVAVSLATVPVVALLAAAAGVAGFWWTQARADDYGKANAGWRAEERVAGELAKIAPVGVVHGALLGAGGDADHVVVGPQLVLVETKCGRGRLTAGPDWVHAGGRVVRGNPVGQVKRQAKALRRKAGVRVEAVVCVVDGTGRPCRVGDVTVCGLKDLRSVIASAPQVLDERQAKRLLLSLGGRVDG